MSRRGRPRRQRDRALSPQWPSISVIGISVLNGGGIATVTLDFNSELVVRNAATLAELTGWKLVCRIVGGGDEVLQADTLTAIAPIATGGRVTLTFPEEIDELYAWRLIIPANQPNIGGAAGRPVGGWADPEGIVSGATASGWIVIPSGGIDALPLLAWVDAAGISLPNSVELTLVGDLPTTWTIGTPGDYKLQGIGATGVVGTGGNIITATWAAVPGIGDEVTIDNWPNSTEGDTGARLAPFRWVLT